MSEPFSITIHAEPAALTLSLTGDLDISTVDVLESCLSQIDGGVRRVVLDLQDLEFLDSSGLNLFVHTYRRFGPELRELMIANPRPNARTVLEVSGVDQLIPVLEATLEQGIPEPA